MQRNNMAEPGDSVAVVNLVHSLRDACIGRDFMVAFTSAVSLARSLVAEADGKILCLAAQNAGGIRAAMLGLQLSTDENFVQCCLAILYHVWGGGLPPFDAPGPAGTRVPTSTILTVLLDAVDTSTGCLSLSWARWCTRLVMVHARSSGARTCFGRVVVTTVKLASTMKMGVGRTTSS